MEIITRLNNIDYFHIKEGIEYKISEIKIEFEEWEAVFVALLYHAFL